MSTPYSFTLPGSSTTVTGTLHASTEPPGPVVEGGWLRISGLAGVPGVPAVEGGWLRVTPFPAAPTTSGTTSVGFLAA